MRSTTVAFFCIMVLAQWLIPLRMVLRQESAITKGRVFRFRTQPIDPSDPFRGKYIVLRFGVDLYRADTSSNWTAGETAFVLLDEDSAGFARIKELSRKPPGNTADYVRVRTSFVHDHGSVQLEFPFERFYVEESKASDAEQAYWQAAADTTQVTYAEVSVLGGEASLLDVKINGRSIVSIVDDINRAGSDKEER